MYEYVALRFNKLDFITKNMVLCVTSISINNMFYVNAEKIKVFTFTFIFNILSAGLLERGFFVECCFSDLYEFIST